jgi:hypothetical protein
MTDFLGTLPGWLTSFFSGGLLIAALRFVVQNRKVNVERLAAEAAAELGVGNLYAAEVTALRDRLDSQSKRFGDAIAEMERRHREALGDIDRMHRDAMRASEQRHEECLKDRENLRGEVTVLRDEINGLVRVITQASIDRVVMLGDDAPFEIRDAAYRAQKVLDESKKGRNE